MEKGERIVAAAIQFQGLTITAPPPARHHTLLNGVPDNVAEAVGPNDQGFLTSSGRFVRRRTAAAIAVAAEQIAETKWGAELYSEDLW